MSPRTKYVCLFLVSQSRWDQHKKRTRWGFGDFSSCLFLTSLALQPLTSSELDLTLWVHWDGRDNQVAQRPHNKLPACWSCLNLSLRSQYRVFPCFLAWKPIPYSLFFLQACSQTPETLCFSHPHPQLLTSTFSLPRMLIHSGICLNM